MAGRNGVDREQLVDEILMLMPVLMRGIGRPDPVEMGHIASRGVPVDVHVSPGHVQILIALSRGPHSVGQLAEVLGVSRPAATQLVDKLVEHGMVERRHDLQDRRVVLVDYVPGMHEVAHRIMESRRSRLAAALETLTDEEARVFLKGLRAITESFGAVLGEEN
jgi:DNA-binding MarR family transcriptional regulator